MRGTGTVLLCCLGIACGVGAQPIPAHGTVEAVFSPDEDTGARVAETLGQARSQILVQAYVFTHRAIAEALAAARQRGVDVRVIADQEQADRVETSLLGWLVERDVPVWLDGRHAAAHNKVMVIDAGQEGATVMIFLLLAIGLKGGVKLAEHAHADMLMSGLLIVLAGALIPLIAFPILRWAGRMKRADSASIAAHYGSVSVVTFSVGVTFLAREAQTYEGHMIVFLVLLEIPALVIGVLLARHGQGSVKWGKLLHEVFFGKSIFLLVGGLIIGYLAGPQGIQPLDKLLFDLFKGVLALFLLEMGLVAAGRVGDLLAHGPFLIAFAVLMPLISGFIGVLTAWSLDLTLGGALLLATLYASASYIAAPAAMRIAVPEANPGLSIGAALGVTFPFNLFVGIPVYYWMAQNLYRFGA